MAIAAVSSNEIKNRRQELQTKRRWKVLQGVWRLLALSGMMGGVVWTMSLPNWLIKEDSQIEIGGNELLAQKKIRALLPLSYPQSLWELKAQDLREKLKASPPIADAQVNRQLVPPKLIITIRERQPVAVAIAGKEVGFLDREGIFIPKSFYIGGVKTIQPSLKVMGFDTSDRPYWGGLYQLVSHSPVKISEIDWRNPSNLVLKTELGNVHCGAYNGQFSEKLTALGRMRQLTSRVALSRIVYIDLTNPQFPTVQLKPQPSEESKEKDKNKLPASSVITQ